MVGGTVRDIRTGRAIARTASLTETFTAEVLRLVEEDLEFYLVYGPCRHKDVRDMVTDLAELDGFKIMYDRQMPPDTVWIFEGHPAELGFAS